AEGISSSHETKRRKARETSRGIVLVDHIPEDGGPPFVDRRVSYSLRIAHHKLLRPPRRVRREARHSGESCQGAFHGTVVVAVVPRPVSGQLIVEVHPFPDFVVVGYVSLAVVRIVVQ